MGYFSDEFEDRHEELRERLLDCIRSGGVPERDMPDVLRKFEDMELIVQTEFF